MKRRWLNGLIGIVAIGLLFGFLINGCSTMNARPNSAELARERQSAQWSAGRFSNPQPMWSDIHGTLFGLFASTRDQAPGAAVPVVSDGGAT